MRVVVALLALISGSLLAVPTPAGAAGPSSGCQELNDPSHDALYGNRELSLTLSAGETVEVSAGPPTALSTPTTITLENPSVDMILESTVFPGTISYVVPANVTALFEWRVDTGNATWTVSCLPLPPGVSSGCQWLNDPSRDALYGRSDPFLTLFAGETVVVSAGPPTTLSVPATITLENLSIDMILESTAFPGTILYVVPADITAIFRWEAHFGNATWNVSCLPLPPGVSSGCQWLNDPSRDALYGRSDPFLTLFAGETVVVSAGPPTTLSVPATITLENLSAATVLDSAAFPGTVSYVVPADITAIFRWEAHFGNATWTVGCRTAFAVPNATTIDTVATSGIIDASGGPTIQDTATLANGADPAGIITFRAFGPDDPTCTGDAAFTSTKAVSGNGSYTSDALTVQTEGTYRWVVEYGGDANNLGATSPCNAPNETSTVTTVCAAPPPPGTLPGNNIVIASSGLITMGTPGDDVIYGTAGTDGIAGLGGNDVIFGLGARDHLAGGEGKDTLCGGDGNDQLAGGASGDLLVGGLGDDELAGDSGDDRLIGGTGTDKITGGRGSDTCTPGSPPLSQTVLCETIVLAS